MAKKTKKKKADAKVPAVSFEKQLTELEDIVDELESGEKSLDESLKLYEQGVAALKNCHAVLNAAEKRIKVLVEDAGGELAMKETAGLGADDEVDDEEEDGDTVDEDDEEAGEEEVELF